MKKSLWPSVDSEEGTAFAFQLAAAGAYLLASATAAAFVTVLFGFQSAIGYPPETPAVPLLVVLAGATISSLNLGITLGKHRSVSAWLFAILVLGCFFADAWWGSGSALWLVIVLAILSFQGVRASLAKKRRSLRS